VAYFRPGHETVAAETDSRPLSVVRNAVR